MCASVYTGLKTYTLVYNICIGPVVHMDTHAIFQTQYNPSVTYGTPGNDMRVICGY